ncbi:unnamed protein product [Porites evermanni]|uniref:Ribosomal protein S11 n=1 Tax=Porites evermanni TaxID=104178 RepID=A0ABN8SRN6_9CNID|nr:unnamed protein product [Porites evermanni]
MEKGQRRKRNFRKLFHGTVGRLKPRGMATLDMYSASKSVFIEKGCFLDNIIGLVTRIVKSDTLDSLSLFFKAYLKLFARGRRCMSRGVEIEKTGTNVQNGGQGRRIVQAKRWISTI